MLTTIRHLLVDLRADLDFHYTIAGIPPPAPRWLLSAMNPSLRAIALVRLCALTRGPSHYVCRNLLMSLHSCDVDPGATFRGPIDLPHPFGIVIGRGAVIGARVRILQNVTIGRNRRDGYPTIGDDVVLYAGCVVAGDIEIGAGAVVGANQAVTQDVPAGTVLRQTRRPTGLQSTEHDRLRDAEGDAA